MNKEDCVDLPGKIFEVKEFDLAPQQQKYYNEILCDIRDNINQWSKFEFTAKLMKLREVVSGLSFRRIKASLILRQIKITY